MPREAQAAVARREGEREKLISQRAQQLAQRERAAEEQRRGYARQLEGFLAQAQNAAAMGADATDWAKLARENPAAFAERLAAAQTHAHQIALAQQEHQRLAAEQSRAYLSREFQQMQAKLPEFRDAKLRGPLLAELGNFLAESGFSREEIGNVADHRAYLLALDAMRYRKLMRTQKNAAGKRVATPPRMQRPSAAPEADGGSRLASLRRAARSSGRLDDRAAYVLAALRDS